MRQGPSAGGTLQGSVAQVVGGGWGLRLTRSWVLHVPVPPPVPQPPIRTRHSPGITAPPLALLARPLVSMAAGWNRQLTRPRTAGS